LQYEQHVYQIQKTVSDHNFLELIYVEWCVLFVKPLMYKFNEF
jgi:hypothetical protein